MKLAAKLPAVKQRRLLRSTVEQNGKLGKDFFSKFNNLSADEFIDRLRVKAPAVGERVIRRSADEKPSARLTRPPCNGWAPPKRYGLAAEFVNSDTTLTAEQMVRRMEIRRMGPIQAQRMAAAILFDGFLTDMLKDSLEFVEERRKPMSAEEIELAQIAADKELRESLGLKDTDPIPDALTCATLLKERRKSPQGVVEPTAQPPTKKASKKAA